MIYIISDMSASISAGKRNLYELCNICNNAGIPATMVHELPYVDARYKVKTPSVSFYSCNITNKDIVIFPEFMVNAWQENLNGAKIVNFVQNPYILYHCQPETPKYPTNNIDIYWTVSTYATNYLNTVLPDKKVFQLTNYIDSEFTYTNIKDPAIVFMPRKGSNILQNILHPLCSTGAAVGWQFGVIDGMEKPQVIQMMQNSSIFLSIGTAEGNPTPPLEAIACGCRVVGYDGWSGEEWVNYIDRVAPYDIHGWYNQLNKTMDEFLNDRDNFNLKTAAAAEFVTKTYSYEKYSNSVLNAIKEIL